MQPRAAQLAGAAERIRERAGAAVGYPEQHERLPLELIHERKQAREGGLVEVATDCRITNRSRSRLAEPWRLRRRRHTRKKLPNAAECSFHVRGNRLEIVTNAREHVG